MEEALVGLRAFARTGVLYAPAERRLAFRELGLAIGLAAARRWANGPRATGPEATGRTGATVRALRDYLHLRDELLAFWLTPAHHAARTWVEHRHINQVMLATALAPVGYLDLRYPDAAREE